MRSKWLIALVAPLILLGWTAVSAGPAGQFGHGDDDIPELMKPRGNVTCEKIVERLEVDFVWNAVFRVAREQTELGKQRDARRVVRPVEPRYPALAR